MIRPYRKITGKITSWKFVKEFYWKYLAHKYTYEVYKKMIKNGDDVYFGVKNADK